MCWGGFAHLLSACAVACSVLELEGTSQPSKSRPRVGPDREISWRGYGRSRPCCLSYYHEELGPQKPVCLFLHSFIQHLWSTFCMLDTV